MASMDADTAALLREAVGKHADRTGDGRAVRSRRNTLPGYAPETLAAMAEQGWLALALPEDAGGLGLGMSAAGIVAEGLAGCFGADPFHSLFLAGRVLTHAGAAAELLAGLATGETLPALAWQENPQGARLNPPATRYSAGRVTGQKAWIVGAAGATHFIVSASGPDGLVLVLAEAGASGSQLSQAFRPDGSPMGRLVLDGVPGEVLACGDVAESALRAALDETSVLVAAELMGHIDRMMAMVIEHMKTRRQFGRPIGAFQALQHRAADMFVHQRLARAVLEAGLTRFDSLSDRVARGMQSARLRARLNDTAQLVMRESIQLFGAMGITDENDLSLHVKRCLSLIGWLGSSVELRGYYMDLAGPARQAADGRI